MTENIERDQHDPTVQVFIGDLEITDRVTHLAGEYGSTQPVQHVAYMEGEGRDGATLRMPMGYACELHTHRTWVPTQKHHIRPRSLGGSDAHANLISVCANGHYEIQAFLELLMAHGARPPHSRHFGPKAKRYARAGWLQAGSPRKGKK